MFASSEDVPIDEFDPGDAVLDPPRAIVTSLELRKQWEVPAEPASRSLSIARSDGGGFQPPRIPPDHLKNHAKKAPAGRGNSEGRLRVSRSAAEAVDQRVAQAGKLFSSCSGGLDQDEQGLLFLGLDAVGEERLRIRIFETTGTPVSISNSVTSR